MESSKLLVELKINQLSEDGLQLARDIERILEKGVNDELYDIVFKEILDKVIEMELSDKKNLKDVLIRCLLEKAIGDGGNIDRYAVLILAIQEANTLLEHKIRKILQIGITPFTMDSIIKEIMALQINVDKLNVVASTIVENAFNFPRNANLFAKLCQRLCTDFRLRLPNESKNFRSVLLNLIETIFFREIVTSKQLADLDILSRQQRSIGIITFIGESFNEGLLTNNIISMCIRNLLNCEEEKINYSTLSELKLECLCKLLEIIGKKCEEKTSVRNNLSDVMDKLKEISTKQNPNISTRVRYIILDLIALYKNNWDV